jgi:hypothetical protein
MPDKAPSSVANGRHQKPPQLYILASPFHNPSLTAAYVEKSRVFKEKFIEYPNYYSAMHLHLCTSLNFRFDEIVSGIADFT